MGLLREINNFWLLSGIEDFDDKPNIKLMTVRKVKIKTFLNERCFTIKTVKTLMFEAYTCQKRHFL